MSKKVKNVGDDQQSALKSVIHDMRIDSMSKEISKILKTVRTLLEDPPKDKPKDD